MKPDRGLGIAMLTPKSNGGYITKLGSFHPNMRVDKNHVRPSVAIDNDGFIHVTGNMHNDYWCYYISDSAYSITGGFTRIDSTSNIPGRGITYPEFYKDKVGELYITFRHKVNDEEPRREAGGVMRHNRGNETFTMLGGTTHGYDKTLVYSDSVGCDEHYQKPSIRLHFDYQNRMHLVATLINESTRSISGGSVQCDRESTHVLHAYSDNRGKDFYNAGGTKILTLPITPNNSRKHVFLSNNNNIVSDVRVGAFQTGTSDHDPVPVVSFRKSNGQKFLSKWNKDTALWVGVRGTVKELDGTINYDEKIEGRMSYLLSDSDGYGTTVFFRPSTDEGGYITRDGGSTFTRFKITILLLSNQKNNDVANLVLISSYMPILRITFIAYTA